MSWTNDWQGDNRIPRSIPADLDRTALVEKMARDIIWRISQIPISDPLVISFTQRTLGNKLDRELLDRIAAEAATAALAAYEQHMAERGKQLRDEWADAYEAHMAERGMVSMPRDTHGED